MADQRQPRSWLERQYADPANYSARAALHHRFGTSKVKWPHWVFDRLDLPDSCRILELGAGPGQLWRQNRHRIPPGWHVAVSDLSPGMVEAAEADLGGAAGFSFQVIDARSIPFDDGAFGAVIANHMLYHVPDAEAALSEIHRVLAPGGLLYAATNGADHMREIWEIAAAARIDLGREGRAAARAFSIENGAELLGRRFSHVRFHPFDESLEVTEVEPLIAYVLSVASDKAAIRREGLAELRRRLGEAIASRGAFHITKATGMFEAARPA
jgi:SAM-dependent methyltransferase